MKISNKLKAGVGGFALLLAFAGGIGYWGNMQAKEILHHAETSSAKLQGGAAELEVLALQHRRFEKDLFLNLGNAEKTSEYLAKFAKVAKATDSLLEAVRVIIPEGEPHQAEIKALSLTAAADHKAYIEGFQKLAGELAGESAGEVAVDPRDANKRMKPLKENIYSFESRIDTLAHIADSNFHEHMAEAIQVADASNNRLLLCLLLAGFATALGGFLLARNITNGIESVRKPVAHIVQTWDLTNLIDESAQDEMGELARSYNQLVRELRTNIGRVREATVTLSAASEELSASAVSLAGQSNELGKESEGVRRSTERAGSEVKGIGGSAQEMARSVATVAAAIEELNASIQGVTGHCEDEARIASSAHQKSLETRQVMQEMQSLAGNVGKVVTLISDIASQTNLLALNATIEAASAGDAGKGFAVVASEVKELARQTASATGEISRQIQGLQQSTQKAFKAMEEIGGTIGEVNQISAQIVHTMREQGLAVGEISRSVAGANQATDQVSSAVSEVESSLGDVVKGVKLVDSSVTENHRTVDGLKGASQDLVQLARILHEVVDKFKT